MSTPSFKPPLLSLAPDPRGARVGKRRTYSQAHSSPGTHAADEKQGRGVMLQQKPTERGGASTQTHLAELQPRVGRDFRHEFS